MLAAINKGERFTTGKYNILRVVAAYPLVADFDSASVKVQERLIQDNHALAQLDGTALIAEFSTLGMQLAHTVEEKQQGKKRRHEDKDNAKAGPSEKLKVRDEVQITGPELDARIDGQRDSHSDEPPRTSSKQEARGRIASSSIERSGLRSRGRTRRKQYK